MSPAQAVLSSRLTYFTKVIFPIVWVGGFGAVTAAVWASNGAPNQMKWTFLTALIVGALSFWWACLPLKKVRIDDGTLYVSNFRKEIALPLDIVERVSENRWVNFRPVTLYFRRFTDFGDKIVFMPKSRIIMPWQSHPVVDEIRQMIKVATAESGKERNSE
jgi:hypothetical protein